MARYFGPPSSATNRLPVQKTRTSHALGEMFVAIPGVEVVLERRVDFDHHEQQPSLASVRFHGALSVRGIRIIWGDARRTSPRRRSILQCVDTSIFDIEEVNPKIAPRGRPADSQAANRDGRASLRSLCGIKNAPAGAAHRGGFAASRSRKIGYVDSSIP